MAFKFKERFVQYLRAARENDPTIPATLEDLAEKAGIHVIQAGGLDGMKNSVAVPWRVALYVAGDEASVKNALLLLDGYWLKETRDEMPVHFHPHLGVDIKSILQDFCSCAYRARHVMQPSLTLGILDRDCYCSYPAGIERCRSRRNSNMGTTSFLKRLVFSRSPFSKRCPRRRGEL